MGGRMWGMMWGMCGGWRMEDVDGGCGDVMGFVIRRSNFDPPPTTQAACRISHAGINVGKHPSPGHLRWPPRDGDTCACVKLCSVIYAGGDDSPL